MRKFHYVVVDDRASLGLGDDETDAVILTFDTCTNNSNLAQDFLVYMLGLVVLHILAWLMNNRYGQWTRHWQAKPQTLPRRKPA